MFPIFAGNKNVGFHRFWYCNLEACCWNKHQKKYVTLNCCNWRSSVQYYIILGSSHSFEWTGFSVMFINISYTVGWWSHRVLEIGSYFWMSVWSKVGPIRSGHAVLNKVLNKVFNILDIWLVSLNKMYKLRITKFGL